MRKVHTAKYILRSSKTLTGILFFLLAACSNSTGPVEDWGFGIAGDWSGQTSSVSVALEFGSVQRSCQTGYMGSYSCSGIAAITGTIRTSAGETPIHGAAYVTEGSSSPVAVYIIANNSVERGLGGCPLDSYDYWAWPSGNGMSGDLVTFCSSVGVHGNPSSRTETLSLRRH